MKSLVFYLHAHQPRRFRPFTFFDMGENSHYFDDELNRRIINQVSDRSYIPTIRLLLRLLKKYPGTFSVSLSICGTLIDQLKSFRPDVLDLFVELAASNNVELVAETYNHSLAYFYDRDEFKRQVIKHRNALHKLFGQQPRVFRNTELAYDNMLPSVLHEMGFDAVLTEGADQVLNGRSPNVIYKSATTPDLKVLLRNHSFSNDIAFRFSDRNWQDYPLTPDKFMNWLYHADGDLVNLFIDMEVLGEHQKRESGIFAFIESLVSSISKFKKLKFVTPSIAIQKYKIKGALDVTHPVSWADQERDLSAWCGNAMQSEAIRRIYTLGQEIKKSEDKKLISDWAELQVSDNYYYICTKGYTDGKIHSYFSPYRSPYDAYIYLMNIMSDLELRMHKEPMLV
ncbi:MAG: glycoside hydrolase family 57 protein [Cyclobacteriaceae bacterium]